MEKFELKSNGNIFGKFPTKKSAKQHTKKSSRYDGALLEIYEVETGLLVAKRNAKSDKWVSI